MVNVLKSRCTEKHSFIPEVRNGDYRGKWYTKNVVYDQLLQDEIDNFKASDKFVDPNPYDDRNHFNIKTVNVSAHVVKTILSFQWSATADRACTWYIYIY